MRRRVLSLPAFVFFVAFVSFVCAVAQPARAQAPDAVGVRAQGMGGAFTAVSDDATATWWNPAGLATGAYLNALIEYGRITDPSPEQTHRAFALAFPAFGLSYYRMTVSEIQGDSSTGASPGVRQDPGTPAVRAVDVSQFGATLAQSVSGHLVVASTLKLQRAMGDSEGGLDVGAMAVFGAARIGAVVRNLREPTFGSREDAFTLRRQVRVGVALTTTGRSSWGGVTVALDSDLRRVAGPSGDERRLAGGAEFWTRRRALGVRGGISGSTVGDGRVARSGGVSIAVRQGLYLDGQLTGGSDRFRRGWGLSLRVTF